MKQHSASFDDGEFSFRVSPLTLDEYEELSDLLEAAHRQYVGGKAVRAFANRFVAVAAPTRNGEPLTVEDIGALDPGLILSLGRQWAAGVRDVPLPLPLPSSGSEPYREASPSPSSSPEPSGETAS